MKRALTFIILAAISFSCGRETINPFWNDGVELFDITQIYDNERFPNVAVATDGTIITTWGNTSYNVRRSVDGGISWGPELIVARPGFHGGGKIARFHLAWLTSGRDWREFPEP
jgi:sialidase-1